LERSSGDAGQGRRGGVRWGGWCGGRARQVRIIQIFSLSFSLSLFLSLSLSLSLSFSLSLSLSFKISLSLRPGPLQLGVFLCFRPALTQYCRQKCAGRNCRSLAHTHTHTCVSRACRGAPPAPWSDAEACVQPEVYRVPVSPGSPHPNCFRLLRSSVAGYAGPSFFLTDHCRSRYCYPRFRVGGVTLPSSGVLSAGLSRVRGCSWKNVVVTDPDRVFSEDLGGVTNSSSPLWDRLGDAASVAAVWRPGEGRRWESMYSVMKFQNDGWSWRRVPRRCNISAPPELARIVSRWRGLATHAETFSAPGCLFRITLIVDF